MTTLYRKYRPQSLSAIIGQDDTVKTLENYLEKDTLPHTILLHGPSGVGKTTIARIIAKRVAGTLDGITEINCGDERSINTVRMIHEEMRYSPMAGKKRVYILDEIIRLPAATQTAFLKSTEEPPYYVQFIFATSSTQGLVAAFLSRFEIFNLTPLTPASIKKILKHVCEKEKFTLTDEVRDAIAKTCEGNGRRALLLLQKAMTRSDPKEQLVTIGIATSDKEELIEFLGKGLFHADKWYKVREILRKLEKTNTNLETIRQQVLAYAAKVLLYNKDPKKQARANFIIQKFEDPLRAGMHSLKSLCWMCCQGG